MTKHIICALLAAITVLSLPSRYTSAEDQHEWAIDETRLFDFLNAAEISELQRAFENGTPSEMRLSTEYGMGRPLSVYDENAIRAMYDALSKITVVAKTDICTTDSDFHIAFRLSGDAWAAVSFERESLYVGGERYLVEGADEFWKQYYAAIDSSMYYYFDDEGFDALRKNCDSVTGVYINDVLADNAASGIVDALLGMSVTGVLDSAPGAVDNRISLTFADGGSAVIEFSGDALVRGGAAYKLTGTAPFFDILNSAVN